MGQTCSPETSVSEHLTLRHNPEDSTLLETSDVFLCKNVVVGNILTSSQISDVGV